MSGKAGKADDGSRGVSDVQGQGNPGGAGKAPGRSKASPTLLELSDTDKARLLDRLLQGDPNLLTPGVGKMGSYLEGRRALAYELADRGLLSSQKLALEILYLLPEGFVNFYQELFHRALSGARGESVMHGRSGGLEKAKGQRGMAMGSEVGLQASGTGKKYKNTPLLIGSERALRIKHQLDQGLGELVSAAREALNAENASQGPGGSSARRTCPGPNCRRFLKAGWKYCPSCGTGVEL